MRAKVGNALKIEFTAAILGQVPGFQLVRHKKAGKNEPMFRLKSAGVLSFFLFLQPDDDEDQFVVEGGWSTTGRFPFDELPDLPKAAAAKRDQFRFRIAFLWCDQDYWWVLAQSWSDEDWDDLIFDGRMRPDEPVKETLSKVPTVVEDAIKKIRKYVLPYYRRVALRHGEKLDFK